MNSSIYYAIEIDIICILVFICIGFNIWKSGDKSRIKLVIILLLSVLQALCDIALRAYTNVNCYALYAKNEFCTRNVDIVIFYSCASSFFALLIPYVLFLIGFLIRNEHSLGRDLKLLIFSIPFLVAGYFTLTSPINGFIQFLIYHGAFVHGKYYSFLVGTVSFYSVFGLINFLTIVNNKKERFVELSSYKIEQFLFFGATLLPFILAPVGLLFDGPLVSSAYAICFFFLMTIHQHMRISIDDLTTLNNRNELKSYLDNLMTLSEAEKRRTFLMFIDVNKFKYINDNYGHNEGDIVLMQISHLLKSVAENFNCFLCRYGGDEFILIKKNANEERASCVCKYIDKNVKSLKELSLAPYDLSVSTGFVRFDRRFKNTQDFIDAADKLMYETKRSARKNYSKLS